MKKIIKWLLVAVMCLGFAVPAWAEEVSFGAPRFGEGTIVQGDFNYMIFPARKEVGGYNLIYTDGNSLVKPVLYSAVPYYHGNIESSISSEPRTYKLLFDSYDSAYDFLVSSFSLCPIYSGSITVSDKYEYHKDFLSDFASVKYLSTLDVPTPSGDILFLANAESGGGSGSASQYQYDSTIPAPQNLKFSSKKSGSGIIQPISISHSLSWSNALLDEYSVRVSVNGTFKRKTSGDGGNFNLMMASDGSDGADSGVPASDGSVSFTMSDIMKKITSQYPDNNIVSSVTPQQYRVQFYKYVGGVLHVGPVGVVSVTRNNAGIWVGTSSTVEKPVDSGALGESGGLYPSGDNWSDTGQGFTDFDSNGNITGSGTVGDDDSYVPSGSGSASLSDFFESLMNSLLNIPNLIIQLFNSLVDMLSGVGELPALIGALFTSLPPTLISVIGVGLTLVVVLRIIGR